MVIPRPRIKCRPQTLSIMLLALFMAGLTGACAVSKKFKVDQIHQEAAARQVRNPIIFIHGFIGAKLRHRSTHETIWGRFINAIKRGKTEDLGLPIDSTVMAENTDDLVPYALYESVAGVRFYGEILDTLRQAGGYTVGDINNPKPGDTCFVYIYDWRRDNVESAIGLGRAIRQIKARLGDPGMRFDIVAHSMGGLVAEYFLKHGARDVLDEDPELPASYLGAQDINRVVLVGTPLAGTMTSFEVLNTGFSRTMSPQALFTMPSVYQLLPSDGRSHFVDSEGTPLDIDLFDADSWVRYGWSIFDYTGRNAPRETAAVRARRGDGAASDGLVREKRFLQAALDRARAFHAALVRDADGGSPIPVHIFGSDCIPTLDRAILKQTASGPVTVFDDERSPDHAARQVERLLFVPGDGTVTANSLLSLDGEPNPDGRARGSRSFSSTYFFCETHGLLPSHRGFQDNLFHVLFHNPARPREASIIGGR